MLVTDYRARQEGLLERIEEGVFIIPSASLVTKSNDTEFPFRQNSFFKYYIGFEEPHALLLLRKKRNGEIDRHLFLEPKDPTMEMWTGIRMGKDKACDLLEIDAAYDNNLVSEELPKLLSGFESLYFDFFNDDLSRDVKKAVQTLNRQRKNKSLKPTNWHHSLEIMGTQRLVKDQSEVAALKLASKLSDVGHRAAMAMAAPGVNEKEIDVLMTYLFSQERGEGPAYDSIVAGGQNALILHYINNNQDLKDGDLLLIDAGAQVNTYASDITRTFPVNGKFTQGQKDLYNLVLEAQKGAMAFMKIGASLTDIHQETCRILTQGLMDASILSGSIEENLELGSFRKYYPHGTGHWLGLDVHDESPYLLKDGLGEMSDIKLEAGMVFTCEPGLYFPMDDPKVPDAWKGEGIRIEDDILMDDKGLINLTSSIPKEVKEVEEACHAELKTILSKLESLPLAAK